MTRQLNSLANKLRETPVALEGFLEPRGVLDFAALRILFSNMPDEDYLAVSVVDSTGHFFRGRISEIKSGEGSFTVLADDGESVYGITAGMIRSARIQSK